MRAKFGVLEHTQGLHLQDKFHLNVCIVSASGGQKPQFWANFDSFGSFCTDPLLPMRAKFRVLYNRPMAYVYQRNFVSIRLFCPPVASKNPIFAVFGLRHLVMSQIGTSLRKLSTVHNYKPSAIQRHQNRFCTPTPSWRNRAHNL